MISAEVTVRIGLVADPGDPAARRLGALLGAEVARHPRELVLHRPRVLWVRMSVTEARRTRWWGVLTGAVGAVLVPVGAVAAPPPGYLRWVVEDQAAALAWAAVGVPLGGIVVVGEHGEEGRGAALAAVSREVASLGARPGIRLLAGDARSPAG